MLRPPSLKHLLACLTLLGAAVPFAAASPTPVADVATDSIVTNDPLPSAAAPAGDAREPSISAAAAEASGRVSPRSPEVQLATPPPPDVNIASQSPCYEKCLADYEVAAAECTRFKDEAQKRSCDEGAYAAYKGCRERCARTANKDCDDKYQDCVDNGPTKCLKQSAGKTLCYRCWERCNAGDEPSAACKECKF